MQRQRQHSNTSNHCSHAGAAIASAVGRPRQGAIVDGSRDGARPLSASARLRRMADKVEIVERVKDILSKMTPLFPSADRERNDRACLVECEALFAFLAGEHITGAEYAQLRDTEVTNFLGGYHMEPLAEDKPIHAVIEWQFEEVIIDRLLECAMRVLLSLDVDDPAICALQVRENIGQTLRLIYGLALDSQQIKQDETF